MIARLIVFFLALTSPAWAAPVEVTSGEHDGFTRVVLNFGMPVDWEFGRSLDGYQFRPKGFDAQYDLRQVFKRIGKSRLAVIAADEGTSALDIGFACACHAIPFEFRPGIIVIDLRDGPPPKGSSFEEPLNSPNPTARQRDMAFDPTASTMATAASSLSGYNWLDRFLHPTKSVPQNGAVSWPLNPSSTPDLQPLREQLLRQLSRGVSEGVVDLSLPQNLPAPKPKADVQAARVALGQLAGVTTKTARAPGVVLGASGTVCVPDETLALYGWGTNDPMIQQLSDGMIDLVGEFDLPQQEAVTKAAQIRLFFGFGLEARQTLKAFPAVARDEDALLALSYIIDGEADSTNFFSGQASCDTAAALWAVLSAPATLTLADVNNGAVILAFSALPSHLRQHLGPLLIDRLLELGDKSTATKVKNMITRASDTHGPDVALAKAKIDLANGDITSAEANLSEAATQPNLTTAKALIMRVQSRIAQNTPVDAGTVTALSAMQDELRATPLGPEIARTLIHANAASGNFDKAFQLLNQNPREAATVWQIVAFLADDSTLLTYAVPAPRQSAPDLMPATAEKISERLLEIGFSEPALHWMELTGTKGGTLLARIHLARRDGLAALSALGEPADDEGANLQAQALAMLGDFDAAARLYEPLSPDARAAALAQAKDWSALARVPSPLWQPLAKQLANEAATSDVAIDTLGPLARGLELTKDSAATRAEIDKLLSLVAQP